jgi:hypothetical protein
MRNISRCLGIQIEKIYPNGPTALGFIREYVISPEPSEQVSQAKFPLMTF